MHVVARQAALRSDSFVFVQIAVGVVFNFTC